MEIYTAYINMAWIQITNKCIRFIHSLQMIRILTRPHEGERYGSSGTMAIGTNLVDHNVSVTPCCVPSMAAMFSCKTFTCSRTSFIRFSKRFAASASPTRTASAAAAWNVVKRLSANGR